MEKIWGVERVVARPSINPYDNCSIMIVVKLVTGIWAWGGLDGGGVWWGLGGWGGWGVGFCFVWQHTARACWDIWGELGRKVVRGEFGMVEVDCGEGLGRDF